MYAGDEVYGDDVTSGPAPYVSEHTHECRDCGAEIPCDLPCYWEGGNDGCYCEEES